MNVVNNGNISISRNLGIKNSTGSWIAFLDSDDFWEKDKLNKLSKKLENYDLIYHNMNILKNNKILKNYNFLFSKLNTGHSSLIENLCKNGNPIINSSVVVRKKFYQK